MYNFVETRVPGPCPCCNTDIEYLYKTENIPYFSDILIISAICPECGYKFVDTQLLKHNPPARYTVAISSEEDLNIRVIRSMSASIEIPELGVRIDPGPVSQGFISNVEGVLDRIEQVVKGAFNWGNEVEQENADGTACGYCPGESWYVSDYVDPRGPEREQRDRERAGDERGVCAGRVSITGF